MAAKRKAGGRPKKGSGPSKSDFIREKLKAGMSVGDIVKAASAAGMKVGTSLIYNVRGRLGAASASDAKTPGREAGKPGRQPGTGMSASDFVRSMPATMKANDVVASGKAKGIKLSPNLVYMVRSADKRKNGRGASTRKLRANSGIATHAPSDLSTFKRLALDLGIVRAKQALAELEHGLAALLS